MADEYKLGLFGHFSQQLAEILGISIVKRRINLIQHDACDIASDWNHSRNFVGPVFNWFMMNNGYHTIHHNRAGMTIAKMLESHPKVEKVWYPGLKSHPDYKVAKKQMRGFGSLITFLVKGGDKETRKFIDSLKLFLITPSLGGSESLVTQMSVMSFYDYPEEYRHAIGMVDNLVRIALGLEDVSDLIADLKQGLDRI
jgi:O-acetylhomoserine/O-acetylserine sulfhydrylase-like pyridoxal-dependent enzyme